MQAFTSKNINDEIEMNLIELIYQNIINLFTLSATMTQSINLFKTYFCNSCYDERKSLLPTAQIAIYFVKNSHEKPHGISDFHSFSEQCKWQILYK